MNSRGQAAIEMIVAAPILAIVIGLGGHLLYLGFAKIWMTRSAREAAACLVTSELKSRCRERFEATLETGLIFGRAEIVKFESLLIGSRVEISFDANSRYFPWAEYPEKSSQLNIQSTFPRKL